MLGVMSSRRASEWLAFVLPHVKAGADVLDCGCGPGNLLVDAAEILGSTKAVGIDINTEQFELGRTQAAERNLTGIEFLEGNMASLPFADESFDFVYAITAIQHLPDPLVGLREIRRVLRPGGIVGIKDEDWGSLLWDPATEPMRRFAELITKVWEHNGGQPFYPRAQRRLLLEAGFARSEASAVARPFGTPAGTRWLGDHFLAGHFIEPNFTETAISQGWTDAEQLAVMRDDVEAWADAQSSFWCLTFCEAVGWVDA
jgi:ubiquinone/menaquinone biosynthesis C-methylase UbiE